VSLSRHRSIYSLAVVTQVMCVSVFVAVAPASVVVQGGNFRSIRVGDGKELRRPNNGH
jgi:hypothetical protein